VSRLPCSGIREVKAGPPEFPEFHSLYLLCFDKAMMIDPGPSNSVADLGFLDKLDYVFVTHPHPDHVGLLNEVVERFPQVQVLVPPQSLDLFLYPEKLNSIFSVGELLQIFGPMEQVKANFREVKAGEEVDLGDRKARVIYSPGHDMRHISLLLDEALFAGDSLGVRFNGVSIPTPWYDKEKFRDTVREALSLRPRMVGIAHSGLVGLNHLNELLDWRTLDPDQLRIDGGSRDEVLRLYLGING
jgi:Zn-dependent hydrolases, including glyoxylases